MSETKVQITKLSREKNWKTWKINIYDILLTNDYEEMIKGPDPEEEDTGKSVKAADEEGAGTDLDSKAQTGKTPEGTQPEGEVPESSKRAPTPDSDSDTESAPSITEGDPEVKSKADYKTWLRKSQKALAIIRTRVEDSLVQHIGEAKTAFEAWEILKGLFEQKNMIGLMTLERQFRGLHYSEDDDIKEHYKNLRSLFNDVNQNKHGHINEASFGMQFLSSLPTTYEVTIQSLSQDPYGYEGTEGEGEIAWGRMVRERIFAEYSRRKEKADNTAMWASKGKGKPNNQNQNQGQGSGSDKQKEKKKETKCFNCNKKGHWKNECRAPKKEYKPKEESANRAEEIKSPQIANKGVSVDSAFMSLPSLTPSNPGPSERCNLRFGRGNKRGRGYRGNNYKPIYPSKPIPSDWDGDDDYADLCDTWGDDVYDNIFDYYDTVGEQCFATFGNTSKWLLDSGATTHVVNDASLLEEF